MAQNKKCPRCGSEIPADAPGGSCPQCALRDALGHISLEDLRRDERAMSAWLDPSTLAALDWKKTR